MALSLQEIGYARTRTNEEETTLTRNLYSDPQRALHAASCAAYPSTVLPYLSKLLPRYDLGDTLTAAIPVDQQEDGSEDDKDGEL